MWVTFTEAKRRKNHQLARREDAKPENPVHGFAHRFRNMKEETRRLVNVAG
jgi:hypothetical protein